MFHKPAQVGDDETGLAQIHSFRQTENRTNTPFVAKNLKVLSRLNTYFFLIYQDVLHTKKYSIFDYFVMVHLTSHLFSVSNELQYSKDISV